MIAPFPPPVHGSAVVSQQIKDSVLINSEFDLDYINLSTSRSINEIGNTGILTSLRKIFRFVGIYFRTFFHLMSRRYDLCYIALTCHGKGFLKDAPIALLCKLFGRRLVIHQHNKGMSQDLDKPIYRKLIPLVYRNAKVILLSWQLYPDIQRVVKKEDVLICPNGIQMDQSVTEHKMSNEVPHILFLSNLLVDKGVLVLLDALMLLKERSFAFQGTFVGGESKDIDSGRFERELAFRGLGDYVKYIGRKFGAEKSAIFSASDIFVFPTNNETFGLVLLEAMQYALPVISTREGGIPDIVIDGETGILVPKKDPEALADAIARMIDNPDLARQMGAAGRKRLEENFTGHHFETRFTEILHSLR